MTVDPTWVAATAAAVSAVFAALTYRLVRREGRQVSWAMIDEKAQTSGEGVVRRVLSSGSLAIVNRGASVARDVSVTINGELAREVEDLQDVHPGGQIVLARRPRMVGAGYAVVEVTWRGLFGRRRSWSSTYG